MDMSGCSISVAGCSYLLISISRQLDTPYGSGVTGSAAGFPSFLPEILCSEGCAAAGNFCPVRDEVCSTATQVATAVLCKMLQRQLEFITQTGFPSPLVGVLSKALLTLPVPSELHLKA